MILFNKKVLSLFNLIKLYNYNYGFSTTSKASQKINFNLIIERLKYNVQKSQQLQKALIDASLGQSKVPINQQKTRIQINKMAPLVSLHDQISTVMKNLSQLNQMKKQTQDVEEKKLILQEISTLENKKQELKQQSIRQLIPDDIYDDCQQITLQFRPGAGGSQACLFVQQFSSMMLSYCQGMGWKTQIISAVKDSSINRGYRLFTAKIQGQDVYKTLKCQSGVHKVIRIPQTQAKGRIHSSTISMAVMPTVPFDFNINDKEIRYEYMRSSGPGGQSVQKTQSACRAVHIPTGMSVMIQEDRSQDRNRKRATQILKQRLFQIEYKKNIQQQVRKRKSQVGTMDRSEKIRTYNYPQDRITDHRTGLTLFGMQAMMSGQYMQKFIKAYQDKVFQQKMEMFMQDLNKGKIKQ